MKKFKKGAASFYIVAFSTLILVVLATSFALVIMSEMARTANDDLSQSAYDSALAGVEDAKVAYSNYRRCKEANKDDRGADLNGGPITCADIIYWVEHPDCYTVGHILGKINKGDEREVTVGGIVKTNADGETTTNQAYTCAMINTNLVDYRATLTSSKRVQTIKIGVGDGPTNNVSKIKLSWYSVRDDIKNLRYNNLDGTRLVFPVKTNSTIATPPMVELQIMQTAQNFTLEQFDEVGSGQTNRGTLYLVPTKDMSRARANNNNYHGIYTGTSVANGMNKITADQVVKTNDRSVMNEAFLAYCNENGTGEFYCSVEIELPAPIGGLPRSNATFMLSLSLPYQQPDTDFSIEICDGSNNCGADAIRLGTSSEGQIKISNSQIAIDSTGRANDLYRRVETRLETTDTTLNAGYPYYALEVLGDYDTKKTMKAAYEPRNSSGLYIF